MSNKEIIYNGEKSYGKLGQATHDDLIKVGDVVSFVYNKRIETGVVVHPIDMPYAFVMGFGVIDFDTLFKEGVKIVVSHEHITNDIINFLNGTILKINEVKPVNLTVRDLEVILGYPVNIIQEPEPPNENDEINN